MGPYATMEIAISTPSIRALDKGAIESRVQDSNYEILRLLPKIVRG